MACTTILVGKKASYDGSTMIARNDDSGSGHFTAKKFVVVQPEEHPAVYKSVISHAEVPLPGNALRMTAMPNAVEGKGIWAASGVNAANVGMTATETITSNPRVLGADPLVVYQPAGDGQPEVPGGIGEEDIVYLVLPYIHSAREGVLRLGRLLEEYGTYEMNGIAFQDVDEIWWLETIGGHHWMARRVPDDAYVVMPNQLGIDAFDLDDAFGAQENHLCSADLREFIRDNHLDLSLDGRLNPRDAFGSHDDADHVYNTPRAWFMLRHLNPNTWVWDGPAADYGPRSDDLPWCMVPERKLTPEDVKYVLSSHYQGTPFDPYASYGDKSMKGAYRSIGINRNDFMALIQMRPDLPEDIRAVEWIAYASNAFNTMVPFYANVERTPAYLACTTGEVSTDSFYWVSRMIAAMADASYAKSLIHVERYEEGVLSASRALLNQYDRKISAAEEGQRAALREEANTAIAAELNGAGGSIRLDMTLAGEMEYYNGLVFQGYLESLPRPVLKGGRYDLLMQKFTPGAGAIGFAVYLDELDRLSAPLPPVQKQPTEKTMLNVALPKGRLGDKVYDLLAGIGYGCPEDYNATRKLVVENPAAGIRYFLVKPSDVAIYVEHGAADVGIVGKDILTEASADVYELLDTGLGRCRMCVAAPADYQDDPSRPVRVATKFVNIAKSYYASIGRDIDIIKLNGSIELAPILGLSDVIVDIVETGTTLRENGLRVVTEFMPISARFIANKASYQFKHREMDEMLEKLRAALAAKEEKK